MPKAWSRGDERQYEAIRESELMRGRSRERAAEIAGRTVNKQRREEGRTPRQRSQGTGNPHAPLESRTVDELYNRARELHVAGRSQMRKAELITAIRSRG
ncbi:MAG: Rho termination factor N-terminal domain-containing protein [Chloroflexi bacterium]|nr:Rho termination factor N-terminal domain-containing protein [Chloroflexota bacterium]MDA1004041.1 Rho termination factor N-terminal domain-containing protein [Chloroflexota bacterium]